MSNAISTWIAQWLQGETVRALGLTLVHFLWEGLALALMLFAAMAFCRRAQARYVLGVCTLGAMLITPLITFEVLSRAAQAPTVVDRSVSTLRASTSAPSDAQAVSEPTSRLPVRPENLPAWCACAWLIGVFVFSLRTLGGWLVLERVRRECTRSLPPHFIEKFRLLEQRLAITQRVRYLQSKLVETPSVVGWLRPVVLLPVGMLAGLSPQQLEAVIVHELAHIRRLDGIVNLFQIAAETLFFYHPAVWWVNKIVRKERENCCDDLSVAICGNAVEYAKALTVLESARTTPTWALSASGGDLKMRVMRLISPERSAAAASTVGLGFLGVLCMTGALLTAAAIAKANSVPVHPHDAVSQIEAHAVPAPGAPATIPDTNALPSPDSKGVPTPAVPNPHTAATVPASAPIAPGEDIAQTSPPAPPEPEQPPSPDRPASSYIEGLKAAGLNDLTVDELIGLKVQGVTPEYIAQMRRDGFDPNVRDLIAMKVQGVTPDYVRQVRSTGLHVSVHDLIGMKVQGVDPSFIHDMQNAGLGEVNAHELIGMKVQGISPAYVHEIENSGLGLVNIHDLIALKVQDVTPEYVRGIRATGLNVTAHDVIAMKVQDVTPDFVRNLQSAGLTDIKAHDCISARVQDVTPEFIAKVKSHGFKNLNIHQLIALKNANVF